MNDTVNGSCFCGRVAFELTLPTSVCAHCHCSMCRRAHGAGFVTWVMVPTEQFRVTQGESDLIAFESSDHGTRSFCGVCGSSLLCVSSHHPDRVDVVLANLDGPIDQEPSAHVYYSNRADWVQLGDSLPRLGGDSGMEPLSAES